MLVTVLAQAEMARSEHAVLLLIPTTLITEIVLAMVRSRLTTALTMAHSDLVRVAVAAQEITTITVLAVLTMVAAVVAVALLVAVVEAVAVVAAISADADNPRSLSMEK